MNTERQIVSCRSMWLVSVVTLLILLTHSSATHSQYPEDPIPVLDFGKSQKAIAVSLHFTGSTSASLESVKVFRGRAHGRAGAPPLLGVDLLGLKGEVIESFNAWNPLHIFVKGDDQRDHLVIKSEATGSIIFPFSPHVATMAVKNKQEHDSHIITIDLVPSLHAFCKDNLDDQDCADIVNRLPVCNADGPYQVECAGGTSSVMLDGTGSSDPDGDPLSYAWDGLFGSAGGATPTVQFSGFGTFNVNLAVSDDFGGRATCSSTVDVVDTTPPNIICPEPQVLECTGPAGADAAYGAIASDTCSAEVEVRCRPASGSVFPIGNTPVTCRASDPAGNESLCSSRVRVVDTTAPRISRVTPSLRVLWPPDHKMVPITVSVSAKDACDPSPTCRIISVTSNEPENGLGDGDQTPDWQITGDLTLSLRAERSGTGSGRVYTITVLCTDTLGNGSTAQATVAVPRSQGK